MKVYSTPNGVNPFYERYLNWLGGKARLTRDIHRILLEMYK